MPKYLFLFGPFSAFNPARLNIFPRRISYWAMRRAYESSEELDPGIGRKLGIKMIAQKACFHSRRQPGPRTMPLMWL